jgi:hypothetical protein
VHGDRGRVTSRRIPAQIRDDVLTLANASYPDYKNCRLTVTLAAYGFVLSRSSVRRIRREADLACPRKRRLSYHRSWRERSPRRSMLLQIDGSQ